MSQDLNAIEIDYSSIPEAPQVVTHNWRPPRHVYFGKKDPESGMMEEEPVYAHQPYPSLRYKKVDGKIRATLVKNVEQDAQMREDGWEDTPAKFGYVGAPDYDTVLRMRAAKADSVADARAPADAATEFAAVTKPKEGEKGNTLGLPKKAA